VTDRRTDGQTDRRTEFSSLDRVCIPCSAVKINQTEVVTTQWKVSYAFVNSDTRENKRHVNKVLSLLVSIISLHLCKEYLTMMKFERNLVIRY